MRGNAPAVSGKHSGGTVPLDRFHRPHTIPEFTGGNDARMTDPAF